jgi:lipoate-protein ligase A
MNKAWDLLPYTESSGKLHMQLDNSLLDRHSKEPEAASILRFYRWTPAAISLGFHQKQYPDHWQAIAQRHNLDILSRPSGGRAVLHKGDLTYAVITNHNLDNQWRSHREVYEHICGFLIQGFANLGIDLSYGQSGRGYIHNPSCFSTATSADLVIADGRKLIGSAQIYRHNSVLQHGSIAILPDHKLLTELFQSEVPVVGYAELIENHDQNHNQDYIQYQDLISRLIEVLSQAARQHFQTEFL